MYLVELFTSFGMLPSNTSSRHCVHLNEANILVHSMLLEIGIFASHIIWLYRTRRVRKEAKEAKMTYDEYISQREDGDEHPAPSPPAAASEETLGTQHEMSSDLEKGLNEKTEAETQPTVEEPKATYQPR
jgi:hypothetical protein